MIVYAARLRLTDEDAVTKVIASIESWLSQNKRVGNISALSEMGPRCDLGGGKHIATARYEDKLLPAFAFRFSHPDHSVHGREWLTEVGVQQYATGAVCTILLHTRDSSAQVSTEVETTRPLVVPAVLQNCSLSSETPGGRVRRLTETDCEAFEWSVRDPERKHPILQISPRQTGGYSVDAKRLNELLVGIADVVIIPEGTDTFAIADALGSRFCAYHGAINILWPMVDRPTGSFVPSTRLLTTDLENFLAAGKRPESELLAIVGHRSNASIARAHLSPERVHALALRAALDKAAKAKPEEDDGLVALYREFDDAQRAEIAKLKKNLENEEGKRTESESRTKELENTVIALQAQLQRAGSTALSAASGLSDGDRDTILRAISDGANLLDCLEAVEQLFRDRLVILSSARTSARKASGFKSPKKAFDLLAKLCGPYYDALNNGHGDNAGREHFGKGVFSPKESETVEGNKRAVKLRTFTYKGQEISMMAHLKIGVKESVAETFRCHFLWDPDDRVIVIGHCGKHLDHK